MGDTYPKFKAAAVQASSVFLDREKSVEKACGLIRKAGKNGAELIVLPEVYVPGGPYWAWHLSMPKGMAFSAELFRNSVEVPSKATEALGRAARECSAYVVIGVNERDNKSIYNTLLFFDREGRILGKHRKLRPTGAEKLVWAEGDGSTHRVYDTEVGRLGGLICGEHTMALPGYSLSAMGEQVHIASWVGFAFTDTTLTEICSRYHAIAYNTFVICSQSVVDQDIIDRVGADTIKRGGAWTAIIEAGTGRIMSGPLPPEEEGIVYAEIDLKEAHRYYFIHENTGHYWPKQFQLLFDARELKPLLVNRGEKGDATPKAHERTEAAATKKRTTERGKRR